MRWSNTKHSPSHSDIPEDKDKDADDTEDDDGSDGEVDISGIVDEAEQEVVVEAVIVASSSSGGGMSSRYLPWEKEANILHLSHSYRREPNDLLENAAA